MERPITLHEMETVAGGMAQDFSITSDVGNVIEISDSNDALGFGMLANPGRQRGQQGGSGSAPPPPPANDTFSFTPSAPQGLAEVEIGGLEPMEPITLNLGNTAPVEIQFTKAEEERSSGSLFSNAQSATGPGFNLTAAPSNRLSPEDERKEKAELLNKLQRLESKGLQVAKRFTMDNTLDEIKQEYLRLVDSRNLEASLRFQRQALMSVVTGLEWANGRFDPFDVKLDGWSEAVHENVEDFDEIFEELYDKYKERGKMPPEARLVMALAGSGFMCHVSNTFLRARMPSMDDILRQNPEMARQFATAAAKQAGPGFGNFMSMAMGGESAGAPAAPVPPTGSFFGASNAPPMAQVPQSVAAMEPRQVARREMKGPSGVDDILKTFDEVRRSEAMEAPADRARAEMQPAMSAAVEVQSIGASEDLGSMTGSLSGRRRGRRAAPPSGSTIALDV
jgi:Family of unknown function (DUF5767)